MAYHAFALIHADSDIDFAVITDRLTDRLRHMKVLRVGSSIQVFYRGWTINLNFVAAPHVVAESGEIAGNFAEGRPDRTKISGCNTRIEITGDVDPDLDHFNDYVGVLDVLSRFDNIVLFDPEKGTFM
jgi:hypothetical protein